MKFSCPLTALINIRACTVGNLSQRQHCSSKTYPLLGVQIQSAALKDLYIHASFTPLGALMAFSARAPRSHCAWKPENAEQHLSLPQCQVSVEKRCSWFGILVPTSGFLNEKRQGLQPLAHTQAGAACYLFTCMTGVSNCVFLWKMFTLLKYLFR